MDLSSEDIGGKIQQILSSPESMAKLQSMLGAMSGGDAALSTPPPIPPSASPSAPPLGGLEGLLSGGGGLDLGVLAKAAPLLQNLGKENEHTRLLHALRPYLHGEREKRLDDAIKMMQFATIAPLLGGSGKGG